MTQPDNPPLQELQLPESELARLHFLDFPQLVEESAVAITFDDLETFLIAHKEGHPPECHCVECLRADEARRRSFEAPPEMSPPKRRREPKRIRDGRVPIEALPLFAPDNLLGEALLGSDRVQEWQQLAPLLEARGLPKVDQTMGGRYVRAVRAFFDHQYGLGASTALAPDGAEDFETWKRKR